MAIKVDDTAANDQGASPGAERRRAPRVFVHLEVDIANDDNFLFAYITDLSTTGIFVRTTTPEEVGTLLQLRFSPEGEPALELEGEVIWVNQFRPDDRSNLDPGMGIRFVDLTAEDKSILQKIVTRMAFLS